MAVRAGIPPQAFILSHPPVLAVMRFLLLNFLVARITPETRIGRLSCPLDDTSQFFDQSFTQLIPYAINSIRN